MAFNFPDAPVVGDTHTEAGVEYVYDGNGVWNLAGGGDMQDYVLKAGDTMVDGPLVTVQPAHFRANGDPPDTCGSVRFTGGAAGRTGMIEFIKDKAAAGDPELRLARFGRPLMSWAHDVVVSIGVDQFLRHALGGGHGDALAS